MIILYSISIQIMIRNSQIAGGAGCLHIVMALDDITQSLIDESTCQFLKRHDVWRAKNLTQEPRFRLFSVKDIVHHTACLHINSSAAAS
jgi:hypothetical protein